MTRELRPALVVFVLLTIVTGLVYPGVVTIVAKLAFPRQAEGSAIVAGERVVGSELLGQPFSDPRHFWGRPSATGPQPYNGGASSGSNLAATNPALIEAVGARVKALREADPGNDRPVPVGSGDSVGQRTRPAHISGRRRVPGCARGAPARHDGGRSPRAGARSHGRQDIRFPGRAPRQRPAAQPGAGCDDLSDRL